MDKPLTKEESYADRRQLFKTIWETAMNINEKDDIMNKPKVIKTLRLDQVDRCPIGVKKKQRIKNLRAVCNKILDFCDRQDADDLFYEQMASEGQMPPENKIKLKPRKQKMQHGRKKMKETKSLSSPLNEMIHPRTNNMDIKRDALTKPFKVSRNTSPIKRSVLGKSIFLTGKSLKLDPKIVRHSVANTTQQQKEVSIRRKLKKRVKRKKSLEAATQAGALIWPDTK